MFRRAVFIASFAAVMLLLHNVDSAWGQAPAAPPSTAPAANEPPPGTLVTLELKNATLSQALKKFSAATGIQFDTDQLRTDHSGQTLTLAADRQPYWDVLAKICRANEVMVMGSTDGAVKLADDLIRWNDRPTVVHGPFRIEAAGIQVRNITYLGAGGKTTRNNWFSMRVCVDPKFPVAGCEFYRIDAMLDQAGEEIPREPVKGYDFKPVFHNQEAWILEPFVAGENSRRISRLSGSLRVLLQNGAETLEVSNLKDPHPRLKKVAGLEFTIAVTPADDGCEVHVKIDGTREDANRINQLCQQSYSEARLLDAKGRKYVISSAGTGPGSIYLRYHRSGIGIPPGALDEPDKLVWRIPTESHVVEVPFTFENLPLP